MDPKITLDPVSADLLDYIDRSLDSMVGILEGLGDDRANAAPALPGANSPYVILTHCLGVMEFWGGHIIAARAFQRDRPAEFTARGAVSDLVSRVPEAKRRLRSDLDGIDLTVPARNQPDDHDPDQPLSNGSVLIHVFEELSQHLGHMEITRDILAAA